MTDNNYTRLSEREMPEALLLAKYHEMFAGASEGRKRTVIELRRLHTQHQADQLRIKELVDSIRLAYIKLNAVKICHPHAVRALIADAINALSPVIPKTKAEGAQHE